MRIAFVSFETIFHHDSETNARLWGCIDMLVDRGHEVHVMCAPFWEGDHDRFERHDVIYHAVADSLEARRSFLSRLPFAIRSVGPDVIHAGATPPTQVLAASTGSTLARVPLIVEWYGDDGIGDDRWTRWALGRGDRLITPSRLVRTWVREHGASGDRIDVIPHAVDCELIRETEPGDVADIVYARRLDEEANLESLLLGLAELRTRDWQTTIIGDGPDRERYERLASDLRIDDRVTFVGEASLEERVAAYRSAHVFVQTARHCVFPTELLWALTCGCVGIVEYHTDSSAHELVEGRDRGFRTTSEQELADAILEAGSLEHLEYDDSFDGFDRRPVLERYLQLYRDLQQEYGLL